MGISAIILLTVYGLNLLAAAFLHGKPKEGKHNFISTFVVIAIVVLLMLNSWNVI